MRLGDRPRTALCVGRWLVVLAFVVYASMPGLVAAQEFTLLDKFSLGIGGSWNGIDTRARLDSKKLGIGTEINFEEDLNLEGLRLVYEANR